MVDGDYKRRFFHAAHDLKKFRFKKLLPNISQGEFFVLKHISRVMENHPEGVTVSDLAKMLKNAPPTTSRFLNNLEEKGWIVRKVNTEDRRNVHVILTEEGKKIQISMDMVMDEFMDTVVNRLGDEKAELLIELIQEVTSIMEEELNKREGVQHE